MTLPPQVATFILLKPSGRMLLQQRDDGKGKQILFPHAWVFPGGAVEEGEGYLDAAMREAKEEFEIEITSGHCAAIYMHHVEETENLIMVAQVFEHTKGVLHEGEDMRWVSFSELKHIALGFYQEALLPYLKEYLEENGYPLT